MGQIFDELSSAGACSIAFTPDINEWMGRENVELKLKDVQFS